MESVTKLAWLALAVVHGPPAVVAVRPRVAERLYGVAPSGTLTTLVTHRGALFLGLAVACALAAVDPGARRVQSLVAAVSVLWFLALYLRAGAPRGPLRTVAVVDLAALLPLAWVVADAWGR